MTKVCITENVLNISKKLFVTYFESKLTSVTYIKRGEKMRCLVEINVGIVMLFFIANKVGPINVKT